MKRLPVGLIVGVIAVALLMVYLLSNLLFFGEVVLYNGLSNIVDGIVLLAYFTVVLLIATTVLLVIGSTLTVKSPIAATILFGIAIVTLILAVDASEPFPILLLILMLNGIGFSFANIFLEKQ